MAEKFKDWLAARMRARALNQTDLAVETEIDSSVISRYLKGTSRPRAKNAGVLADFFGVPREDVFRLIGIELGGPPPRPAGPYTDRVREALAELLNDPPVAIAIHQQTASAGMGDEILEYVYWAAPRAAGRNIIGLRVHGNSMEPDLMDGDVIFVDKDASPHSGDMVIASLRGAEPGLMVVKWLQTKGRDQVLRGNNGDVPLSKARVEGVVVEFSRKLR